MEAEEFVKLIRKRKVTIFNFLFLSLLVVLLFTFSQPLKYRATSKLLLVQENTGGTDAYSLSRSNQFLSNILANVVYSSGFFDKVLDSGYNLNTTIFESDLGKRQAKWKNMVSAQAQGDTGMILIKTFHEDRYQASQYNQAVAYVLTSIHKEYHGLGDKVTLKVIDSTTVSNWPQKPNIIVNILVAILGAMFIGIVFIYLFPKTEFRLLPKRKKKKKNFVSQNSNNQASFNQKVQQSIRQEKREPVRQKVIEPRRQYVKKKSFKNQNRQVNQFNQKDNQNSQYIKSEKNREGSHFEGNINNLF